MTLMIEVLKVRGLRQIISLVFVFFWVWSSGGAGHAQTTNGAVKASDHLLVSFPSSNGIMLGYLYRPPGKGPFPAVVLHYRDHKSLMSGDPAHREKLVNFFTSRGYLLFMPDRHADLFAVEEFSDGLVKDLEARPKDRDVQERRTLERMQIVNRDVVASTEWIKRQPDVDTNNVILVGIASGAMQSLITIEKVQVRACVLFSPAAISWNDSQSVQNRLIAAAHNTSVPVFLIYTDDQNLDPATTLGREIGTKGKPNQTKLYPAFGKTADYLANFATDATDVWGPDVLRFLEEVK